MIPSWDSAGGIIIPIVEMDDKLPKILVVCPLATLWPDHAPYIPSTFYIRELIKMMDTLRAQLSESCISCGFIPESFHSHMLADSLFRRAALKRRTGMPHSWHASAPAWSGGCFLDILKLENAKYSSEYVHCVSFDLGF